MLGQQVELWEQQGYGLSGAGTQTAGLGFGGIWLASVPNNVATEEYNGTSWTAGGNLGTARYAAIGWLQVYANCSFSFWW
jgi:hypothetical protein